MKALTVNGIRIKPHLLIGENVATGCYAIAASGDSATIAFTVLFMTIAERNNKSYDDFAKELVKAAIRLDNDFPPGKNLVVNGGKYE